MDRWIGKVAIVTGASVGIGAKTVTFLVNHGMKVVGLARSLDKLQQLALELPDGKFYPIQCDLSNEDDILKAFERIENELGGADVLINNAGVLKMGPIIDSSTEDYRAMVDVNVIALTICSREFCRSMKKRSGPGHIININSFAGHFAESLHLPFSIYAGTKYAVTGITLSLRNELQDMGLDIKVTSINPGAVKTNMIEGVLSLSEDIKENLIALDTEDIANAIIYALGSPPGVQVWDLTIMPHNPTLNAKNRALVASK